MPTRPPRACSRCGHAVPSGRRCPTCTADTQRTSDRDRGSATTRGYGAEHRERFRRGVLARDRVCVLCHLHPATRADHYPRSRRELVLLHLDPNDPVHGRGLCATCDSSQTAGRQPGGWNRRA